MRLLTVLVLLTLTAPPLLSQDRKDPDWARFEEETLRHFTELVKFDTSDPPGNEAPAAAYLQKVLTAEGIPVEVFSLEPHRPNIVARRKGSGKKRPLLVMGHTDVVNVDSKKWPH